MDIWEANSISAALTPHPCQSNGIARCEGAACGTTDRYATVCDPDGCDFNSFRMGDKSFYGPGLKLDTKKKLTVVTQFITDSGTATGNLKEIRRLYVQNNVVIQNSKVNVPGMDAYDSITDDYCDAQKTVFGDTKQFQKQGGLARMGKAMANGMVLVMSVWDDHAVNMLWLDSVAYPTDADPSKPGIARGTCSTTSGAPTDVETNSPNASVTYSNIRFGDIGSTYTGGGTGTTTGPTTQPTGPTTTSPPPNQPTQVKYGQCGGINWTGPTVCTSGTTCQKLNDYYFQCL
jgi:cellulose 1,4-beta-cellobiosidase